MPPKYNLNARVRPTISSTHFLYFVHSNFQSRTKLRPYYITNFKPKTITAPLAAFSMALILFVYARTSIQAAKRNAQRHREADGGQINWHNENLRRHGKLETPTEESNVVGELVSTLKGKGLDGKEGKATGMVTETENERRVKELAWRRK